MLQLQNTILEMIATGASLGGTAARMCREVEEHAPDAVCSVLTVDRDGFIRTLAGPGLPSDYLAALNGLKAGPDVGSCGAAAWHRTEVAITDIATDPRCATLKHLILPFGLRACWSTPILDGTGEALGTVAFYYRDCRSPTAFEREIVGRCLHLCVIAFDRHQRVLERDRRAFTDALTGLANRAAFDVALDAMDCDRPGEWGLLVLDLDNLKIVNDTFGHEAGDRLLKTAGTRIRGNNATERAFRIGGDEFAVIIERASGTLDLEESAKRILKALEGSPECGDRIIIPRATIGGAVLSAGDLVAERVRQNADFALYHAKETGRGGFVRYWPGLGTNITRRLENIHDVDAALRDHRIEAYYQPVVRLDTREVVGLEALCRMRLDDRIVPASAFHEAMKDVHVAAALTTRMMKLVAADVRAWLDMGIPFQHVGVNVSSADMHGGKLGTMLEVAFGSENVPLTHVIIEVTEGVYTGNDDGLVRRAVEALRATGLRVALDDFGTGFASLNHLLTVPIDILKIDKSFVGRLAPGDASMAIVEGLLQIADKLGIRVVAEGIETEDQARLLQNAGCSLGQGYLFSRAVDRNAATALLLERGQHRNARSSVQSADDASPGAGGS